VIYGTLYELPAPVDTRRNIIYGNFDLATGITDWASNQQKLIKQF